MDVCIDVFRAVDLNDPVHRWEVNSTRTDICTEENGVFLLNELEVDRCTFVLLHLAVELH